MKFSIKPCEMIEIMFVVSWGGAKPIFLIPKLDSNSNSNCEFKNPSMGQKRRLCVGLVENFCSVRTIGITRLIEKTCSAAHDNTMISDRLEYFKTSEDARKADLTREALEQPIVDNDESLRPVHSIEKQQHFLMNWHSRW